MAKNKASDMVAQMQAWIGYSEKNGKYKRIIDIYNSCKPLARGYAVQYSDEWCATTVSAAAIECGTQRTIVPLECSCNEWINLAKNLGIWEEDGTITPKPGYVILYSWKKNTQPNNAMANHIGVVERVDGNQITVIEGNKNEAVARRVIPIGWGYIRGYGIPKYAEEKTPVTPTPDSGNLNRSVTWYGIVNCTVLNVRTGPGTQYPNCTKYKTVTRGMKVGVCDVRRATTGENWYYVCISGSAGTAYGYVSAAYIQKQSEVGAQPVDPTVKPDKILQNTPVWTAEVTAKSLNIRKGAGTNYPRLSTYPCLARGTVVELCDSVYANDGSLWYYIRINKRTYGFASASYLKKITKL